MTDAREMQRSLPWPFHDARFPVELGAVVQRMVIEGEEPARVVIHDDEGDWLVGDGRNDPNAPGAAVATHISHVVALNSSVADLADLPPGWQARRLGSGEAWVRYPHSYD